MRARCLQRRNNGEDPSQFFKTRRQAGVLYLEAALIDFRVMKPLLAAE